MNVYHRKATNPWKAFPLIVAVGKRQHWGRWAVNVAPGGKLILASGRDFRQEGLPLGGGGMTAVPL